MAFFSLVTITTLFLIEMRVANNRRSDEQTNIM